MCNTPKNVKAKTQNLQLSKVKFYGVTNSITYRWYVNYITKT